MTIVRFACCLLALSVPVSANEKFEAWTHQGTRWTLDTRADDIVRNGDIVLAWVKAEPPPMESQPDYYVWRFRIDCSSKMINVIGTRFGYKGKGELDFPVSPEPMVVAAPGSAEEKIVLYACS